MSDLLGFALRFPSKVDEILYFSREQIALCMELSPLTDGYAYETRFWAVQKVAEEINRADNQKGSI